MTTRTMTRTRTRTRGLEDQIRATILKKDIISTEKDSMRLVMNNRKCRGGGDNEIWESHVFLENPRPTSHPYNK